MTQPPARPDARGRFGFGGGTANNGWRAPVSFGPYVGLAAMVDWGNRIEVAFPMKWKDFVAVGVPASGKITIGGEICTCRVDKAENGNAKETIGGVAGMIHLSVTALPPA